MKKIIFIVLIAITAISCKNKYENAISDYVQSVGDTKTNLNFKLKSVKEIKDITAGDSLKEWKEAYEYINNLQLKTAAETMKLYADDEYGIFKENFEKAKADYDSLKSININDEPKIKKYAAMPPEKVINKVIEVVYTIKNPVLNNAEQTITRKFVVSPDGKNCYGQLEE